MRHTASPSRRKAPSRSTAARPRVTRRNSPLLDENGERTAPPYRKGVPLKRVLAKSANAHERRGWVLFKGARNNAPYAELWDDQGFPDGGVYVYRWWVGDANEPTVESLVARVQADIEIALNDGGLHELDSDFEVLTRGELKRRWGKLFA
jgi:hypothetical protein